MYHQWLPDIGLIQISVSFSFIIQNRSCLIAGKRFRLWKWHSTRGHRKTIVFTPIVDALKCQASSRSARKRQYSNGATISRLFDDTVACPWVSCDRQANEECSAITTENKIKTWRFLFRSTMEQTDCIILEKNNRAYSTCPVRKNVLCRVGSRLDSRH